jgi:hypothetical protein
MAGTNFKKILPCVLITLLGISFIVWGLTTLVLGFAGKSALAVVTNIRREGGERNETIRGRYTYITGYTFSLPDGKHIDGYSRSIGNSVFLKADGKSKVKVKYFSCFPYINALAKDTKPGLSQIVLVALGCFLIVIMNRCQNEEPGSDLYDSDL